MAISKQEIKYILYSVLFAFIWFFIALPQFIAIFDGNSPITQFIIFNLGFYIFFFIFLKAITLRTSMNFSGTTGLLALFLALDTWMPDYHVSLQGELIKGALLGVSSTDYVFGYIGQNILGLHGILVFGFTYLLVPIILLIIAAKLLPNFIKHI